jgi:hypothetical protein
LAEDALLLKACSSPPKVKKVPHPKKYSLAATLLRSKIQSLHGYFGNSSEIPKYDHATHNPCVHVKKK